MKRLFIIAFCALTFQLSPFTTKAQEEYQVFSINGTAQRLDGKQWKTLVKAQPLTGDDQVRTSKNGTLTILDNNRRKIYAVQSEKGGKVETLTATQRARAKSLTQEAFTEVTKAMFGKQDERYATRGGVTYRGDNADEQVAAWLKASVNAKFNIRHSSFTVALHALNPVTHKTVRSVQVGETVELMVVNESDEALYVGVIDIDAESVWSAVSPNCELMPPHSTVILPYPIEFYEPRGTDHLLLVAYTEMYDPVRVVELYRSDKELDGTADVGAAVTAIEIR